MVRPETGIDPGFHRRGAVLGPKGSLLDLAGAFRARSREGKGDKRPSEPATAL